MGDLEAIGRSAAKFWWSGSSHSSEKHSGWVRPCLLREVRRAACACDMRRAIEIQNTWGRPLDDRARVIRHPALHPGAKSGVQTCRARACRTPSQSGAPAPQRSGVRAKMDLLSRNEASRYVAMAAHVAPRAPTCGMWNIQRSRLSERNLRFWLVQNALSVSTLR